MSEILIDACYLNSPGGIVIFERIINEINESDYSNTLILVDKRINTDFISKKGIRTFAIDNKELFRIIFYLKNHKRFIKCFCVANLPPPFLTFKFDVYIYFHNLLYLEKIVFHKTPLFYLKKLYLKFLNKKQFNFIVQTGIMKTKLKNSSVYKKNKIYIFPVFKGIVTKNYSKKNFFFYPISSISDHKNLNILISAFVEVSKMYDKKIHFIVTAENQNHYKILPQNLTIEFLGKISQKQIVKNYKNSKFMIFPSKLESFGLPLIEATFFGCYIIASELDYVKELIKPSLMFDPFDQKSIEQAILYCLNYENKLSKSKALVEDQTSNLIKLIF